MVCLRMGYPKICLIIIILFILLAIHSRYLSFSDKTIHTQCVYHRYVANYQTVWRFSGFLKLWYPKSSKSWTTMTLYRLTWVTGGSPILGNPCSHELRLIFPRDDIGWSQSVNSTQRHKLLVSYSYPGLKGSSIIPQTPFSLGRVMNDCL